MFSVYVVKAISTETSRSYCCDSFSLLSDSIRWSCRFPAFWYLLPPDNILLEPRWRLARPPARLKELGDWKLMGVPSRMLLHEQVCSVDIDKSLNEFLLRAAIAHLRCDVHPPWMFDECLLDKPLDYSG